jgi:hypothetical protein
MSIYTAFAGVWKHAGKVVQPLLLKWNATPGQKKAPP